MTSELFTIFGSSKVASSSGTCSGAVVVSGFLNLASPVFCTNLSGNVAWVSGNTPQSIVIPKGTAFKIWEERLSIAGGVGRVNIDTSHDSGVTYNTIATNTITALSGTEQVSIRRTGRPLVIPAEKGTSGYSMLRFPFDSDAATGGIFADFIVEIVELNE